MRRDEFAKLIDTDDIDREEVQADTLYFVRDGWRGLSAVAFLCPCGCEGFHILPVYPKGTPIPEFCVWEYTRTEDKITLSPSLLNGCKAHFFIRENKIIWC